MALRSPDADSPTGVAWVDALVRAFAAHPAVLAAPLAVAGGGFVSPFARTLLAALARRALDRPPTSPVLHHLQIPSWHLPFFPWRGYSQLFSDTYVPRELGYRRSPTYLASLAERLASPGSPLRVDPAQSGEYDLALLTLLGP